MTDSKKRLEEIQRKEALPASLLQELLPFFKTYAEAAQKNGYALHDFEPILNQFLDLLLEQVQHPFIFQHFHQCLLEPFNYYKFGLDFIRPLVRMQDSHILNADRLEKIREYLP